LETAQYGFEGGQFLLKVVTLSCGVAYVEKPILQKDTVIDGFHGNPVIIYESVGQFEASAIGSYRWFACQQLEISETGIGNQVINDQLGGLMGQHTGVEDLLCEAKPFCQRS
jgi:hypothetical protein